jgi:hypothetical protein
MAERIIVFRKTRADSRNFAAKMGKLGIPDVEGIRDRTGRSRC